jgi:hypothetical protein
MRLQKTHNLWLARRRVSVVEGRSLRPIPLTWGAHGSVKSCVPGTQPPAG